MAHLNVFATCVQAINDGILITREHQRDKEYHFQNWFRARLQQANINFDQLGRNAYPDFVVIQPPLGFEVKGLAYPGREVNYDCNSQVPSGHHNGRSVFYVFGRYPANPDGDTYPVLDLVICHGDFLNADHNYIHRNRSVRGFGSYGDIMIRDRKMYVAPTPFGLTTGTAHHHTLILPEHLQVDQRFQEVGQLVRREAENVVVGYTFNLQENTLQAELANNPNAGMEHRFRAYRLNGAPNDAVVMRPPREVVAEVAEAAEDDE